ncbi:MULTISPECIES: EF-hand domain-containing protein [unclassified Pseudoalteromonas]|uniref:EF-hand domain-containing protein n=1 Tax=unclassified Pseudoalteromonas TaxID=194690 RepID=UPI0005A621B3|nr:MULTISPECIES: EF-hand domain-containing protein [unclassified Pseudoalteromonas]
MTKITKKLNIAVLTGLISVTAALSAPQVLAEKQRKGGKQGKLGYSAEQKFNRIDVDQSGEITLAEMTDPATVKAEKKLTRKDTDQDSVLSLEEFSQGRHGNAIDLSVIADEIVLCVSDLKAETGDDNIIVPSADNFVSKEEKFNTIDADANGTIDLSELQTAMETKATSVFEIMDTDDSSSVNLDEFTAASESNKATKKAIRQCVQELTDED